MESGGNAMALSFFRKHDLISKTSGIDYKSSYIQDYKNILLSKVNSIIRERLPKSTKKAKPEKKKPKIKEEKKEETKKIKKKPKEKRAKLKPAINFNVLFEDSNVSNFGVKKKVQARKIKDINFENLTLDDNVE